MKKVTLMLNEYLHKFYKNIGENAGGIRAEEAMVDMLFRLAGELSADLLNNAECED